MIFSKEAEFTEVTFSKEANFIYAKFSKFADFSHAKFLNEVRFSEEKKSKIFDDETLFRYTIFEQPNKAIFDTLQIR
jgi:Pentapeptide repeats (9 copies)